MPELPDVTIYVEALKSRLLGPRLIRTKVSSPFILRTFEPPLDDVLNQIVESVFRIGKRIVVAFTGDYFLAIHLMIAGRLRWLAPGAKPPGKIALASFDFDDGDNPARSPGTLVITEASQKKRAALHVLRGRESLLTLDAGGIDVLACELPAFREALTRENHTLKRALTDPRLFAGIGNAYSDEILHAAGLSPVQLSERLDEGEIERLYYATQETLRDWIDRLRSEFAGRFPGPGEITAFRPGFAVHGRFGQPCPRCGTAVRRIRYAENETNYCPRCQTDGRILADRSLSRLLRGDWPRHVDELDTL